jgi:hypothetical protein
MRDVLKRGFTRARSIGALVLLGLAALVLSVPANAQNYPGYELVKINVPGAGGTFLGGTSVWNVNNLGEIGGWYGATNGGLGSFLRYQDGRLAPYIDAAQGAELTGETWGVGLNDEGATTGVISQQQGALYSSFIRKPNGTFINFTPPGPCATVIDGGCLGYGAQAINDLGQVAGTYLDDDRVYRSFIRYPDGRFEIFVAPGAASVVGSYTGTIVQGGVNALNQLGAITGTYADANGAGHGFIRWPNGTFLNFDVTVPAPAAAVIGTFPLSINDLGVVAGYYLDANSVFHGFIRQLNGKIITLDAPGADNTPGDYNGTFAFNLNIFGEVIGSYYDANNNAHGYVRYPDGRIWEFDPPDYTNDVEVFGINAAGVIVGNSLNHNLGMESGREGFALIPRR